MNLVTALSHSQNDIMAHAALGPLGTQVEVHVEGSRPPKNLCTLQARVFPNKAHDWYSLTEAHAHRIEELFGEPDWRPGGAVPRNQLSAEFGIDCADVSAPPTPEAGDDIDMLAAFLPPAAKNL